MYFELHCDLKYFQETMFFPSNVFLSIKFTCFKINSQWRLYLTPKFLVPERKILQILTELYYFAAYG